MKGTDDVITDPDHKPTYIPESVIENSPKDNYTGYVNSGIEAEFDWKDKVKTNKTFVSSYAYKNGEMVVFHYANWGWPYYSPDGPFDESKMGEIGELAYSNRCAPQQGAGEGSGGSV